MKHSSKASWDTFCFEAFSVMAISVAGYLDKNLFFLSGLSQLCKKRRSSKLKPLSLGENAGREKLFSVFFLSKLKIVLKRDWMWFGTASMLGMFCCVMLLRRHVALSFGVQIEVPSLSLWSASLSTRLYLSTQHVKLLGFSFFVRVAYGKESFFPTIFGHVEPSQ